MVGKKEGKHECIIIKDELMDLSQFATALCYLEQEKASWWEEKKERAYNTP